jgi:hypothetical protein
MNPQSDEQILRNCSSEEIGQLQKLASSTTAGIWRIKRAKALLGALQGISPERLMYQVRVPVISIVKCINDFSRLGMAYFDTPARIPTQREAAVERMLALLDNPSSAPSDTSCHLSLRYIGTQFTANQIRLIREMIRNDPNASRNSIARQMCLTFNLYGPNGKPRNASAVDMIKRMIMDNLISIPVRVSRKYIASTPPLKIVLPLLPIKKETSPKSLSLSFVLVQKPEEKALWNAMIYHFHYIPIYKLFGPRLRYLVFAGNHESSGGTGLVSPLAALSFSSSAWRVSCRDDYIGWNDAQRVMNLPLVINNSRFLILPWVKVPNLASAILGTIGRRVGQDWETRYNRRPVLLESFVERNRFRGTCYKAANWLEAGTTVGYSLHGTEKKRQQTTKAVFLRPLQKNFRDILCQPNHG